MEVKAENRKMNWDAVKQFLHLSHGYWLPITRRSPMLFAFLLSMLVLFTLGVFAVLVSSGVLGADKISHAVVSRTAPGLVEWIKSIISSPMKYVFIFALLFPLAFFAFFREKLNGRFKPWFFLFLLIVLMFAVSGLNVIISYVGNYYDTALAKKDHLNFFYFLKVYGLVFVVGTPIVVLYRYIRNILSIYWRKDMTEYFVNRYLSNRAYYSISYDSEIDNPDQRISEDIRYFTNTSLTFLMDILGSVLDLIAFTGILWAISKNLTVILVFYAVVGTIVTLFFGKKLVGLNFNQLKKEADMRYGLIHVRNNAESIAFYQGEVNESKNIFAMFKEVLKNYNFLIGWQRNLDFFTTSYRYAVVVLPALIMAPSYFAGKIEFGTISQAGFAFTMVHTALSLIVTQFAQIAYFAAGIKRVALFDEKISRSEGTRGHDGARQIATEASGSLEIKNLNLETPDGARILVEKLNVALGRGERLLIAGPSGVGKTSLLRAIAGLWDRGDGSIARPDLRDTLFLPQKPYMVLGSLRDQIVYPKGAVFSDAELEGIMSEVMLGSLADKMKKGYEGNIFDRIEKWDDYLSQGEQQRLAFSRVLAVRPDFVILDEATSALDVENEKKLYSKLVSLSVPYVSIGHRPALANYHDRVLLLGEGGWELLSTDEYMDRMERAVRL